MYKKITDTPLSTNALIRSDPIRFISIAQGYTCASQVPASVFERRARIRVRVAKITTVEPPTAAAAAAERASSDFRAGLDGKGYPPYQSSSQNESYVDGKVGQGPPSDGTIREKRFPRIFSSAVLVMCFSLSHSAINDWLPSLLR